MKARKIKENIWSVGSIDWNRVLFDALIPLPDGTSYNAYVVKGTEKIALLDTVDPPKVAELQARLDSIGIDRVDYLVAHHAEQDHSGSLPMMLERYPEARIVTTPKGRDMLMDLMELPESSFMVATDGMTLDLGGRTLEFIYSPWVHWPETMVTWLPEERLLFSCDLFGSHMATSNLFVKDKGVVMEAARRYFAEIMMPFSRVISKNLKKITQGRDIEMIAPSHGAIYDDAQWIIQAYQGWVDGPPANKTLLPYISMHESTRVLVDHLTESLIDRDVEVVPVNLESYDVGRLAMEMVDAATVVLGSPTVLGGPHPAVVYAAYLAAALRPRVRHVSVIGSFGWGGRTVEQLAETVSVLKAEVLEPVMVKGLPRQADLERIEELADSIVTAHGKLGLMGN